MNHSDIKIAIVDDHPVILSGVEQIIRNTGIDLVFCVKNKKEFFDKMEVSSIKPNLVLIDIEFPENEPDGFKILSKIKKNYPRLKTAMYSIHSNDYYVQHSLALGANGYFTKNIEAAELIEGIKKIMDGRITVSSGIKISKFNIPYFLPQDKLKKRELSPKEEEVMLYLCNGLSRKEIAAKMNRSIKTIDFHCDNVFFKADVHKASALVSFAIKKGWIIIKVN